jgi:NADPH:quinone reductase-like Zn-dependent oxidoreductase
MAHGQQRIDPPRVICADGAGVVEESADPRWVPGDEVVLLPTVADGTCEYCKAGQEVFCPHFGILGEQTDGTACQRLQVPGRMVYAKPAGTSWEEAAAFPLTFLTAYRMLTTRARLRPGETLLVVGAGAGVGVAAIRIGKHLGAKVYATSRSEAKQEQARKIGADEAFATEGFANPVRELTGKLGVDVIFDSVGAATVDEDLKAVRLGGRIVSCGSTSGPKVTLLWPRLFFKHADILGSTMGNASEFQSVLELIGQGVKPVVDSTYPLAEVEKALTHLDAGEQFGKVILRVSD